MFSDLILPRLLLVLGLGFLAANIRLTYQYARFLRVRSSALLTWPGRKPPFYGLLLALGVTLGILVFWKTVIWRWSPTRVFGETMMFLYYAYGLPLSLRIGRGFYEHGIWSEGGFVPYSKIGGMTWREGDRITLVLIDRVRNLARRLDVPEQHYAAVRRLLRDKIASNDIHFTGKSLDLGDRDQRDDV